MKIFKKYVLPSIYIVAVLLVGAWLSRFQIMKYHYKSEWKDASPEEEIKKHEKVILEDREILKKYDVFKPSKGTKDAGPYLNKRIHWEIGDIHHKGDLVLPDFIHKEMNKDWVNKKPLFKKMGMKFDWMKELHQFDYWNPEENSPAYPEGKRYPTYSFPIPSYKDLVTWSKLRLLYGREKGDLVSAFKDVRHLARLIFTNDYLVSSMITISMLRLESEIHEGNWEIIPEEDLMRAKRYFYAVSTLIDPRLTDETFAAMVSSNVGKCPMIVEGLMNYISMRELLHEELKDEFKRIVWLVNDSQEKCRRTIVHKMWEDPDWPSIMSDDQDAFGYVGKSKLIGKEMTWGELKKEDDLKALVGFVLGGVGGPNYLNGYSK